MEVVLKSHFGYTKQCEKEMTSGLQTCWIREVSLYHDCSNKAVTI